MHCYLGTSERRHSKDKGWNLSQEGPSRPAQLQSQTTFWQELHERPWARITPDSQKLCETVYACCFKLLGLERVSNIANTLFQQHKRRLYTWTSPDGQHWNQIDYILCSQRWRSSIQSAQTRPGADCGSEHELLIAKFRLKLKKVGKTTRPFRYDLNQIPCDYTVEVRNRLRD